MKPLVVVDMQVCYTKTSDKILPAVLQEIAQARAEGQPIVLLRIHEADYFLDRVKKTDEIYPEVLAAVKGYDKVSTYTKWYPNGGPQVKTALRRRWGLTLANPPEVLRIVGVNTGACVRATAEWLADDGFNVEVLPHATNDNKRGRHHLNIRRWLGGRQRNLSVAA